MTANSRSSSDSYRLLLTGSRSDPLSIDEIIKKRHQVVKRFEHDNPTGGVNTISTPKIGDDYDAVAYSLVVRQNGHTNQFIGKVSNDVTDIPESETDDGNIGTFQNSMEESENELIASAKDYIHLHSENDESVHISSDPGEDPPERDPGENTSNDNQGEDLVPKDGFSVAVHEAPMGKVELYADIWSESGTNSGQARTDLRLIPGENIDKWNNQNQGFIGSIADACCNGTDHTPDVFNQHLWDDGYVVKNQPSGNTSGSTTVGASIGGSAPAGIDVGLSWSYSPPPIRRTDDSNSSKGDWVWEINSGGGSTQMFKTGTRVRLDGVENAGAEFVGSSRFVHSWGYFPWESYSTLLENRQSLEFVRSTGAPTSVSPFDQSI